MKIWMTALLYLWIFLFLVACWCEGVGFFYVCFLGSVAVLPLGFIAGVIRLDLFPFCHCRCLSGVFGMEWLF